VRHLEYKGQEVALQSESKGYRFKLTPPVPVTAELGATMLMPMPYFLKDGLCAIRARRPFDS
jgi:hypothetical protein